MHARILVVDDEVIVQESTRLLLKGMGYTVTGLASSPPEAMALIEQDRPDLVLMDINLGADHEGIAMADLIRERHGLPIVYVTAYTDAATLERAKITRPFGYVAKPFYERDLQVAVEVALYNHQFEQRLGESEARYRALFDDSPIAIWEEDFSGVKQRFDELSKAGTTDWRRYFDEHPGELADLAARVRIVEVNRKSVELLGADDTAHLKRHLPSYFTAESLPVFKEELIALASGRRVFRSEIPINDNRGRTLCLDLTLSVQPGHDHDLSRVIVSFMDVTARKKAEEELKRQVHELKQFNDLTIGRELTMVELKKRINALLREAGRPEEFQIAE